MPRNKRFPGNSGLQVPVVVYFPEKWRSLAPPEYQAGGTSDRLISFVDFAPTMLSLAGLEPPEWMQGHAFVGKFISAPQPFVYGFRGRMDERDDLARSVTDGRYVYLRNYRIDLPWGQHIEYMFQTPTTRAWKALFDAGKLNEAQSVFWKPKPPEELYDLQSDPDEVHNLADSAEHAAIKARLRTAQQELARRIRDLGFLPEGERLARAGDRPLYDFGHSAHGYPFDRVFAAAELAATHDPAATAQFQKMLTDPDSGVRYWAVLGLRFRGAAAIRTTAPALQSLLADPVPEIRVAAAQNLAQFATDPAATSAVQTLAALVPWGANSVFTSSTALQALDLLDPALLAPIVKPVLATWPQTGPQPDARYSNYVPRLLEALATKLSVTLPPAPAADGKKKPGVE
jgi:uncharacterized sulfatase